ncbi:MAG: exodeoxyribonuclease gamma subunit [Ferruginibacter sp.]|nr:exodeoxyribonuclease gamma subunit [Ferruginibacter sp.]
MAFQLQVSNSLTHLAARLAVHLQTAQPDVFQPVYIVTQTEGMNNWLKLQLAELIGIAANLKFLKPNDLINQIHFMLGHSFSNALPEENVNWLLYKLLGEDSFINAYPAVAGYYNSDGPDKDVKRMALAEKLGDLFDQYQIYRPEMISAWNEHRVTQAGQEWQKDLWLSARNLAGESFPDKTQLKKNIQEALKDQSRAERLHQKMPYVFLFGISLITEFHLQIFQEIAPYIDIHFLLLNPAPEQYWFEDKNEKQLAFLKKKGWVEKDAVSLGNPLLTGWGKIIQDTFSMLFQQEELINAYDEVGSVEPPTDNLLHRIQHSVYHNAPIDKTESFTELELNDGSLTINSCYSPAREVEVLYDYLVQLVDKRKAKLSPRDIVVLVSDIDLYASYIKAIFNNAAYPFRYTIADESFAASESISDALHALLSLSEDNFTAEEVISLLDSSFIRKQFGITDTGLIRTVLNEANIRFGVEGNSDDESMYVSWNYGLRRIMFGICMSGSEEFGQGEDSFYPLDIIEGNAAQELIRFVYFAQRLIDSLRERKNVKTIKDWAAYAENILTDFVETGEDNSDEDLASLLKQFENYQEIGAIFTEEISYDVFVHNFLAGLSSATRKNSFAAGGITFCSLIPMRSIPFKVVGLLGLNFDKFPRKENKLGFNLMDKERKGDRNVKENDKHLFLETILSASDYLYISYIGQSIKDNSSIPPSTLVDELADFIASSAAAPKEARKNLITKQPLHSFSKQYNAGDPKLYSYRDKKSGTKKPLLKTGDEEPINFSEINIHEMIRFLKNPFKGYYNKMLGIYYHDEETLLRETELFEVNQLQGWSLKNELLHIDENESRRFKDKLVKTGALPLKNMAELAMLDLTAEVAETQRMFRALVMDAVEEHLSIDLAVGEYQLRGSIGHVYDHKLVIVSWSKRENKYLLDAYLTYLVLRASGYAIELHFISNNKQQVFQAPEITVETAMASLMEIVDLYVEGHRKIIAFDPDLKIEPAEVSGIDETIFNKAIKEKFTSYGFPCNDTYMNKEYEHGFFETDHVLADYEFAAEKLLAPLASFFPGYFK